MNKKIHFPKYKRGAKLAELKTVTLWAPAKCGQVVAGYSLTNNPRKVTCKTCLKCGQQAREKRKETK